jgi:phage N-6-adenine-methyltransferase
MSSVADKNRLAYIGAKPGRTGAPERDSGAWFTPAPYARMVEEVLGQIDLDPFSADAANVNIRARRYFTAGQDAYRQRWFESKGTVFMNPPYTRGMVEGAVELFLAHWETGVITQGIVLVNNATETCWFQSLLRHSSAVCFTERRIAFENVDGKQVSGNTRGQAFFYFGRNVRRFADVFGRIGKVLVSGQT